MKTMKSMMLFTLILGMIGIPALAQDGKRSKSLNFEDEMVEGINRKPLDSVNQISENNNHKKAHLYKKRATFSDRDQILVRSLGGTR